MKVRSKITGIEYEGDINFSLEDTKGSVWIDNRLLATYRNVKSSEQLEKLFLEDYEKIKYQPTKRHQVLCIDITALKESRINEVREQIDEFGLVNWEEQRKY